MNRGQSVFAQLLSFVPFSHFEHLVDQFGSNHGIRHFSAWNWFLLIVSRWQRFHHLSACLPMTFGTMVRDVKTFV